MTPAETGDELARCPLCGFVGDLDDFDVLGADEGNLFCNNCWNEITPEEEL